MKPQYALLAVLSVPIASAASASSRWSFELLNQNPGIVVQQSVVVSPTLALLFDRASDDPLQINNHSAGGALWNLETSTVRPLNLLTNSFCASGALLSNGTMVSMHTH